MPVEISQSGGLTFRVTDTTGKVKFDINKKQPKVIETFGGQPRYYANINCNYIIKQTGFQTGGGTQNTFGTWVVASETRAYQYPTNVSPTNGFLLVFIMFPNSGSYDNTNLVYASSGSTSYNARHDREAMFIHPLGAWIPANGGKIIRHYFTQTNITQGGAYRGFSGTQLFFYNWRDNPSYSASATSPSDIGYYKYIIYYGLTTKATSMVGARSTTNNSSLNLDGHPIAIYNMSGGINTVGVGTAKMKATECYMATRFYICK
tara:strand:+ start:559 stop:1344 length:786 start_codon:yes stop_codon:yes gene_type:complete